MSLNLGKNQIKLAFLLDCLVKSQIKIREGGGQGMGTVGGWRVEFNHIISCVSP